MKKNQISKLIVSIFLVILIICLAVFSYAKINWFNYDVINNPKPTHYHFRIQMIIDSIPADFTEPHFQTQKGDVCTSELTDSPIHVHDENQVIHIHWDHMTGGLFLKDYGLNYIGGLDHYLGFTTITKPKLKIGLVTIHGQDLPKPNNSSNFYVYIGNADKYTQKNWSEFLQQDLKVFFSDNLASSSFDSVEQVKIQQNISLIGNVIIYAQRTEPSASEIKNQFQKFIPIKAGECE